MLVNNEVLKDLNPDEKKIINVIQKNGYMAKSQISFLTNIKLATLNYLISALEKKGLMQNCIGESTGGRRPVLYDINICKFYVIGIDISQKYAQVVITNMRMEILYREKFCIEHFYSLNEIMVKIYELMNKAYFNLRLDIIKLLGIGVACVGEQNLSEEITQILEKKYKCLVVVENRTNAAAIGEYFYGIGKGYKSFSYFNCGSELKSGIILSSKLFNTSKDDDYFGHMVIDVDGEQCRCGNYGCIECYSSIDSIIRKMSSEIKKGRHSSINKAVKEISYKDICSASENDDALAKAIITDAALMLGAGLANYANMLNPEIIVLDGPLINESEIFYEICIESAYKKINLSKKNNVIFKKGGYLEESAAAIGGGALVIEKYLDNSLYIV